MRKILKCIRFNLCIWFLLPKLVIDGFVLIWMSPAVVILGNIPEYLNFDLLGIISLVSTLYIYLGFLRYGSLIHDKKFQILIGCVIGVLISKDVLFVLSEYHYFYPLMILTITILFVLFIAFWFIKERGHLEERLAKWFRNGAFMGIVMLLGHRLMIFMFTPGKIIYTISCLVQVIVYIIIAYKCFLVFKNLHVKYSG